MYFKYWYCKGSRSFVSFTLHAHDGDASTIGRAGVNLGNIHTIDAISDAEQN